MKKMITAFLTLIFLTASSLSLAASNWHYAIIVDAGSSGSRFHLFQYQIKKHHSNEIPVIQELFSTSIKPGLSSYANHPENAGPAFSLGLNAIQSKLNENHILPEAISLHILATAGMRLLPKEKQAILYNALNQYISQHYAFKIKKIATISGQKEGLYGWLDINYLANNFNNLNDRTLGSLDVGGASIQIAFSTHDFTKPKDEETLLIAGHRYTVFSKSFIGLGQDQARLEMNVNKLMEACYPTNYPLATGQSGNFNFSTCANLYRTVISNHGVAATLAHLPKTNFIGYSSAYYAFQFFHTDLKTTEGRFEKHIQRECSKTWEQLQKDYNDVDSKYLGAYCANATYIDYLFYDTFQLGRHQLVIKKEINGKEIDWTLGALLYDLL